MYRTKYYDLAITYSVVLCPVHDLRWIIYFAWIIFVLTGLPCQSRLLFHVFTYAHCHLCVNVSPLSCSTLLVPVNLWSTNNITVTFSHFVIQILSTTLPPHRLTSHVDVHFSLNIASLFLFGYYYTLPNNRVLHDEAWCFVIEDHASLQKEMLHHWKKCFIVGLVLWWCMAVFSKVKHDLQKRSIASQHEAMLR